MFSLPLWILLLAGQLSAGTVWYQATSLGSNFYRYDYTIDYNFLQYQELDIKFDPTLYSNLTNGVASSDFNLVLLQPNNPSGTSGDYSLLALIGNPTLAGPFSVKFMFLGAGEPGSQLYFINQFDPSGQNLIDTIESGSTVPEPANWLMAGAGLIVSGMLRGVRNRK